MRPSSKTATVRIPQWQQENTMNRRNAILAMVGLPFAAKALDLGSVTNALGGGISDILSNKLGVNSNQAQGGLGAMLTLAKEKLSGTEYGKIAGLIPDAAKYIDLAKKLGAVVGPLKNMAGLNKAFGKLGMNQETSSKFVPTVTDVLSGLGGDTVKGLLGKVFK
jgi:hypothetical protein